MKKVLAMDIGGTNFRGAIFDENYNIEKRLTLSTIRADKQTFINQAKELVSSLIDDEVVSIAIGVPGVVDPISNKIINLPNVGISDVDLANELKKEFNVPCSILNDAEIASLGEGKLGAGKEYDSLYFITISTGLGGALFSSKSLEVSSCEIGHQLTEYRGKYDEWEHLASGTGIVNLAKLNGLKIDKAKEMFDLYLAHDELGIKVYNEWMKIISNFIRYINTTYEPEVIALTGGVSKAKDIFLNELISKTKANIVICKLGEDAGLYGAAVLAFKNI